MQVKPEAEVVIVDEIGRLRWVAGSTAGPVPLVYVMSPYHHHAPRVRANRARAVATYIGHVTRIHPRAVFYSPIAYYHPIAIEHDLPTDEHWWRTHNLCMIRKSQLGVVLNIEGWQASKGIAWELEQFEELRIPVVHDVINWGHEVVGKALQELA